MKDANAIATEAEIRERRRAESRGPAERKPVWGTLSVWLSASNYLAGSNPDSQEEYCTIDLSKPGLMISYDENNAAEIWAIEPFMVFNFVPERTGAGE